MDEEGEEIPKEKHTEPPKIFLFNHLRFTILYHEDAKRKPPGIRIVGFEVEPFSVKHTYLNQMDWKQCLNHLAGGGGKCNLNTCSKDKVVNLSAEPMLLNPDKKGETEVVWTYDVFYKSSPVRWSTRWDAYLQSADDAQVMLTAFLLTNQFFLRVITQSSDGTLGCLWQMCVEHGIAGRPHLCVCVCV